MFTPTKQQLEELGITWDERMSMYSGGLITIIIWRYISLENKEYKYFIGGEVEFYPESIDDLKTLIRMLTPPNN